MARRYVSVDDGKPRAISRAVSADLIHFPPTACYSQAHYEKIGGALDNLDKYDTVFVDSITAISRLSFRRAEQQPEAFSDRSGKKDVRGAYGLHAREMIKWLHQLQHARGMNVIFVGILEKASTTSTSRLGSCRWKATRLAANCRASSTNNHHAIHRLWRRQAGARLCLHSAKCLGLPAKDRAGRLEQIEEPHLGKLI